MRYQKSLSLLPSSHRGFVLLAIIWLSGILCGIASVSAVGSSIMFSLMRSSAFGAVSIVGLLGAAAMPFLLSVLSYCLGFREAVYGICFCKAFVYSFVSLNILIGDRGGWLFRFFLLFGDFIVQPALFLLWLRILHKPSHHVELTFLCIGMVLLAVAVMNYRIIAPYFVCLIDSMKG